MSTICSIRENNVAMNHITELSKILGDSVATLVITLNNGFNIDQTPSGKKSILFELLLKISANWDEAVRLKALVYSDEFRSWFGDWITGTDCSKVVDINEEPKVVWHHTNDYNLEEFSIEFKNYFSTVKQGTKKAIFFTDTEDKILERLTKIPVYLNIQNAGYYDGTKDNMHVQGISYTELVNLSSETLDGTIFTGLDDNQKVDQTVYVIHDPINVKAIKNSGEFSKNSPKIYHHKRLEKIYNDYRLILENTVNTSFNSIIEAKQFIVQKNRSTGFNYGVYYNEQDGKFHVRNNYKSLLKEISIDKFERDLSSGDVAEYIVSYLQDKFPGINIQILDETQFNALYYRTTRRPISPNSYIYNDTVYIKKGLINPEILIEEFLHPLIHDFYTNNRETFYNLVEEARTDFPKLAKEIELAYQYDNDLENSDVIAEELLTQATSRYLSRQIKYKNELNTGSLISFFKYCAERVVNFFKTLFDGEFDMNKKINLRAKDIQPENIKTLVNIINSKEAVFRISLNGLMRNHFKPSDPTWRYAEDSELKDGRLANTDKLGRILLRKLDSVELFFSYIKGEVENNTSEQKKLVFEKLADAGYTEKTLRKLILTTSDAEKILMWHERSHVLHLQDDLAVYAQDNNLLAPEKIEVETRATLNAIENLIALKSWESKKVISEDELSTFGEYQEERFKISGDNILEFSRCKNPNYQFTIQDVENALMDFQSEEFDKYGIGTNAKLNEDRINAFKEKYPEIYDFLEKEVLDYNFAPYASFELLMSNPKSLERFFEFKYIDKTLLGLPSVNPDLNVVSTSDGKVMQLTAELKKAVTESSRFLLNPSTRTKFTISEGPLTGVDLSRIHVIDGKAGCGKTTIVKEIIDNFLSNQSAGSTVLLGAISHKATQVIAKKVGITKKSPIQAKTVASMIGMKMDENTGEFSPMDQKEIDAMGGIPVTGASLIVLDECSMITDEALKLILENSTCPILVLGDSNQLPPIGLTNDAVFFRDERFSRSKLTLRIRQGEDSPILELSDLYSEHIQGNSNYPSLQGYPSKKNSSGSTIIRKLTPERLIEELLPSFKHGVNTLNPNYCKIVCYHSNPTFTVNIHRYNQMIHNQIFPGRENQYCTGDMIMFYGEFGDFKNSQEFAIKGASDIKTKYIDFGDDSLCNFEIKYQDCIIEIEVIDNAGNVSIIDKVISIVHSDDIDTFKQYCKSRKSEIFNKYTSIYQKQVALKQLDEIKSTFAVNVDFGYAITSHKSQGSTYDIVAVDIDDIESNKHSSQKAKAQSIYTALTRSRNITLVKLFTGEDTAESSNIEDLNIEINAYKTPVVTESVQSDDKKQVVAKQFAPKTDKAIQLYDFLHYVTGDDTAYIDYIAYIQASDEDKNHMSDYPVKLVHKLLRAWTQRQLELLKFHKSFGNITDFKLPSGHYDFQRYFGGLINIFEVLNEERAASLNVPEITDYKVREAQVVMGRLNASKHKLGNTNLRDIDLNFFKRVNNYYHSDVNGIDFLVRTHNSKFGLSFLKNSLQGDQYGFDCSQDLILTEDGWRLDAERNKMYKVPVEVITLKNGETKVIPKGWTIYRKPESKILQETLVFLVDDSTPKVFETLLATCENLVSTQAFIPNLRDLELAKKLVKKSLQYNQIKTFNLLTKKALEESETLKDLNKKLKENYESTENKNSYITRLSNCLYNSFWKTLHIISARIPTLDMQSFMPMEIKAFSDGESNNAFVSRWQFWLQGSDMDIDKAYMMGVDVNNLGLWNSWSPLANVSRADLAEESDNIPAPNGIELVLKGNYNPNKGAEQVYINISDHASKMDLLIQEYYNAFSETGDFDSLVALKAINKILEEFNKTGEFNVLLSTASDKRFNPLIKKLNKHNLYKVSDAGIRNIVFRDIRKVSTDPRNMMLAYSPIDKAMDLFKLALKTAKDTNKKVPKYIFDGFSKGMIQEANSDGKLTVGIMANGIKVFFALTSYFNNYFSDIRKAPQNVQELMKSRKFYIRKLNLCGEEFTLSAGVSDIKLEKDQIALFNEAIKLIDATAFDKSSKYSQQEFLYLGEDDASLMISALISLATDNAKELALAKMNASILLASMHIYLAAMGIPADKIVNYTKSPLFTKLASMLKANPYLGADGKINDDVWKKLDIWRAAEKIPQQEFDQLKLIYESAKELKRFASILGVNQGMKNDIFQIAEFENAFKSILTERLDASRYLFHKEEKTLTFNIGDEQVMGKYFENRGIKKLTDEFIIKSLLTDQEELDYKQILVNKMKSVEDRARMYNFDLYSKVDSDLFFKDKEYREFIIDLYDILKVNFNVYDALCDSPNFYAMLEAVNKSMREIISVSAKAKLLLRDGFDLYRPLQITNNKIDIYEGDEKVDTEIKFTIPGYYTDPVLKAVNRFYDDYVISDFISSNEWFKLNFGYNIRIGGNISKLYSFNRKSSDGTVNDDLSNKTLEDFKLFVNDVIIPRLRKIQKDNPFIKSIVKRNIARRGQDPEMRWVFKFNIDQLTSDYDKLRYEETVGGFNSIQDMTLGQILGHTNTIEQGLDLKLGDILYMYNFLFNNQFGLNSLSLLFDKYISDSIEDSLPMKILEHYTKFDTGEKTLDIDYRKFMYFILKGRLYKTGDTLEFKDGDPIEGESKNILINIESTKQSLESYKKANILLTAIKNNRLDYEINC